MLLIQFSGAEAGGSRGLAGQPLLTLRAPISEKMDDVSKDDVHSCRLVSTSI